MPDAESEINALFSEFNTKIADLEGKYELLKERIVISNESFLKNRENTNKEIKIIRDDIREIRSEIDKIKEMTQHLMSGTEGFARKEELKILERYMKLWEPLKFVKEEEVRAMIDKALENLKIRKSSDDSEEISE